MKCLGTKLYLVIFMVFANLVSAVAMIAMNSLAHTVLFLFFMVSLDCYMVAKRKTLVKELEGMDEKQ